MRLLLVALVTMLSLQPSARAQEPDAPADRPAVQARLAPQSLLLDLARAGDSLVAVGERGHVLVSDDNGRNWTQATSVPTQSLLTAVHFIDRQRGYAVGHDEVVLATDDGGVTWTKSYYAPDAERPLLDVWFADAGHGIAVGAYGAWLTTSDGGASWQSHEFTAEPLPGAAATTGGANDDPYAEFDLAPPSDYHLNALASSGRYLYIAAEAGRLFRSADGGTSWIELPSPYEGSYFGALALDEDSVLVFGLRGRLYRSDDAGMSWRRIDSGTVAMLTDGVRVDERTVVVVGLSGVVLVSRDDGATFTLHQQAGRRGLSAVELAADGRLVVAGEGGVWTLDLPPLVSEAP